jgi:ATPase subunit of ABC transporter with duplicated ATPase domains
MLQHEPPTPASAPLVSVRAVDFSYGATPIFENLNLVIPAGLTVLYGVESCGKSTLIRLLAGDLSAEKGLIEWHWLDSAQWGGTSLREHIYWIDPRDPQHDAHSAQAYFGLLRARYTGFSDPILSALLPELGLSEHLEKPLYMLSTGSKRKVWLAGAFASQCRLTLLDEPFAALDQRSVGCFKNWLNRMSGEPERAWVIADYQAPTGMTINHCFALNDTAT